MTHNRSISIHHIEKLNNLSNDEKLGIEFLYLYGDKGLDLEQVWEQLTTFKNLKYIDFNEFISVTLHECTSSFQSLKSIDFIDVSFLHIDYQILQDVSSLNSLKFKRVSNFIHKNEHLFTNVQSLTLENLSCFPFQLDSPVWKNITSFSMSESHLDCKEVLQKMLNLNYLNVRQPLNHEYVKYIPFLSQLNTLEMTIDNTTVLEGLDRINELKTVFINQVSEENFKEILKVKTLESFTSYTSHFKEIPTSIDCHEGIKHFKIGENSFPNYDYYKLFPNLTEISISKPYNKVKKEAVTTDFFLSFNNLQKISINIGDLYNTEEQYNATYTIPSSVKDLTVFSKDTKESVNLIFEENSQLEKFYFGGNYTSLNTDFSFCSAIKNVEFKQCSNTHTIVDTFAKDALLDTLIIEHSGKEAPLFNKPIPALKSLENLEISSRFINGQDVLKVCSAVKSLKYSSYGEINDFSFLEYMTSLEKVTIKTVSPISIDFLPLPQLKEVEVDAKSFHTELGTYQSLESLKLKLNQFPNKINKALFKSPNLKVINFDTSYDSEFKGFSTFDSLENEKGLGVLERISIPIDRGFILNGNFPQLSYISLECTNEVNEYPIDITSSQTLKSISISNKSYYESNQITSIPDIDPSAFPSLIWLTLNIQSLDLPISYFELPHISDITINCEGTLTLPEIATPTTLERFHASCEKMIIQKGWENCHKIENVRISKQNRDNTNIQINISGLAHIVKVPATAHYEVNISNSKAISFFESLNELATSLEVKEELAHLGFMKLNYYKEFPTLSLDACLNAQLLKGSHIKTNVIDSLAYHSEKGEKTLNKESKVLILGKFDYTQKEIIDGFANVGIKVVTKLEEEVTHVALGKNLKTKLKPFDLSQPFAYDIINATKVNAILQAQQEQYLIQDEEEDGELVKSVTELLQSNTEENLLLVISLIEAGGVPKSIQNELFYRLKISRNPSIKKNLKKTLITLLPNEFQGPLSDRKGLDAITKHKESKASSELEKFKIAWGEKITMYCACRLFDDFQKGYYFILNNTDFYDERRKPVMEYLAKDENVYWQREKVKFVSAFKLPKDLPYFTKVRKLEMKNDYLNETDFSEMMKEFKDLEYLNLCRSRISSFEFNPADVQSLKKLDLSDNKLEAFPQTLTKISTLEVINLRRNNITEIPEEVRKALPNCKILF